jgi:hypothetical protein
MSISVTNHDFNSSQVSYLNKHVKVDGFTLSCRDETDGKVSFAMKIINAIGSAIASVCNSIVHNVKAACSSSYVNRIKGEAETAIKTKRAGNLFLNSKIVREILAKRPSASFGATGSQVGEGVADAGQI